MNANHESLPEVDRATPVPAPEGRKAERKPVDGPEPARHPRTGRLLTGNPAIDEDTWWTIANGITVARLLIAPVLFWLIITRGATWLNFVFWIVLCVTDTVDGWVARRRGVTASGAFIDPLADKILVIGCMVVLVWAGAFWWVPVALMAAREVAMSVYRTRMSGLGISIPASKPAKAKTWVQVAACSVPLAPGLSTVPYLTTVVLWAAVALTLWTGYEYWRDGRRLLAQR